MKLKLNIEELEQDFFEDTRLIGIVAPIKYYQLYWRLNQALRFQFKINNDIEIQLTKKGRKYFFSVSEFQEPTSPLSHFLYNNQFDGEYLLPEFKHLDFLWLMKGDTVSDERISEITNIVKSIKEVQLIIELTNEKIKNKGHLIF